MAWVPPGVGGVWLIGSYKEKPGAGWCPGCILCPEQRSGVEEEDEHLLCSSFFEILDRLRSCSEG